MDQYQYFGSSSSNGGADTLFSNVCQEEEFDFSDVVLKYINHILMEENPEENNLIYHEDYLALQSAEKPFYEILGQKYPTDPEVQTENFAHGNVCQNAVQTSWIDEFGVYESSFNTETIPTNYTFQAEAAPRLHYNVQVPDVHSESELISQFRKGVEEANKFLPDVAGDVAVQSKSGVRQTSPHRSRGKKNVQREDIDFEGQNSNKQLAAVQTAMFDMALICNGKKGEKADSILRESLNVETSKNLRKKGGRRTYGKKQTAERDLADLLNQCAEAVAAGDHSTANELLKQLRQHSSPDGDGSQRLAHYFVNGLEARLAGSGSQINSTLQHEMPSVSDILKAHQLYMVALPFAKISYFFANQTIGNLAGNATSIHIIDFGILFGFQWPGLIRRLSKRKGGPPKLRITGIEFPLPGFRPAAMVEETGRRLRDYAEGLNVPFEYHGIAQKWETIQLEDLKINKDEPLVVNCIYRTKNLLDESVILDSPRDAVLNLIRKMNPTVFVHGILNGTYNSPFFLSRFREALFYFSSLFDVFETVVPRENSERTVIERYLFGKEAFNITACEGSERIERPESYKQWQSRNTKAGFTQLPLNTHIIKKATEQAISDYHRDFIIDEDSQWLRLGWKGRTLFAISSWRPA